MIKEALKYIVGLAKDEVVVVGDRNYSVNQLHPIKFPQPASLHVGSLTSIVEYVKTNVDGVEFPAVIHVVSPTEVKVYSALYQPFEQRDCYIEAEARIPEFRFGSFIGSENFIIAMQSKFVPNDHTMLILSLVGNVSDGVVRTFGDDGVSQTVQAKTGLARVGDVAVPNPVLLKPFRTFVEVEQPESLFVFRMRSGHETPEMALFEADGGAWKNQAMLNIRQYLATHLSTELDEGKIVIIS